jgi:hypothetical protein
VDKSGEGKQSKSGESWSFYRIITLGKHQTTSSLICDMIAGNTIWRHQSRDDATL